MASHPILLRDRNTQRGCQINQLAPQRIRDRNSLSQPEDPGLEFGIAGNQNFLETCGRRDRFDPFAEPVGPVPIIGKWLKQVGLKTIMAAPE